MEDAASLPGRRNGRLPEQAVHDPEARRHAREVARGEEATVRLADEVPPEQGGGRGEAPGLPDRQERARRDPGTRVETGAGGLLERDHQLVLTDSAGGGILSAAERREITEFLRRPTP